jgi:regulatory protein
MEDHDISPSPIELAPSRRHPGQVELRAAGRAIGTLSPASITSLGLRGGESLTPDLAERVAHRMALERSYKAAGNALARRPMTSSELRERLERRGFDPAIIDETLDGLAREGLVNDADVARAIVRHSVSHGGAGATLLESKLAAKGVDTDTARRVLDEELADADAGAEVAARHRIRSIPHDLSIEAKARRLYAYLARRGFDEHASAEAVRRVLGTDPESGAEQ